MPLASSRARRVFVLSVALAVAVCWLPASTAPVRADDQPPAASSSEDTPKRSFWQRLFPRRADAGHDREEAPPEAPDDVAALSTAEDERLERAEEKAAERAGREAEQREKREQREARRAAREQERLESRAHGGATPRSVARVHQRLKASPIAADPDVRAYLDRIDGGESSSAVLNDFAVLLADHGLRDEAVEYQRAAVRSDRTNPIVWLNLGTLQQKTGDSGAALAAFRRALALDPTNAMAYYNLGAALDERGEYDQAVEAFDRALALDPTLADPERNPQIVNNDRLLVISLIRYRKNAGSIGLDPVPIEADSEN